MNRLDKLGVCETKRRGPVLRLVLLLAMAAVAMPGFAGQVDVRAPGIRIRAGEQPESAEVQLPGATITVQPGQQPAPAGDTIDLAGAWKFKGDWLESGVAEGWQNVAYDDAGWKDLQVPGAWEDQGIMTPNPHWPSTEEGDGYNGYAWYRKHVTVPADWAGAPVTIEFGAIGDYDWTFVNGTMVGSSTSGDVVGEAREYPIPSAVLKPGADNVIAVRVLNQGGKGGIADGPVVLRKGGVGASAPQAKASGRYTKESDEVVRVGGSVTIPAEQKVNGDVVAVGGSADISGWVTGSVVAVGGSVHAQSGSEIDGDAVAVGGSVEKDEGAVIRGQTVTAVPGVNWRPEWDRMIPQPFGGPGHFFTGLLGWSFIALLAMLLFRHRLEVMAEALPLHPGRAAASGLIGIALTPAALVTMLLASAFVIVVLAITIVGILVIPAAVVAMLAATLAPAALLLAGMAGVFLSLGRAISGQLGRPEMRPISAVLIGVLVVCVAGLIPVIGWLMWITVAIFGFGLALMTGVGSREHWSVRDLRRHGRQDRPEEPEPVQPPAPALVAAPEPTGGAPVATTQEAPEIPPAPETESGEGGPAPQATDGPPASQDASSAEPETRVEGGQPGGSQQQESQQPPEA